MDKKFEIVWPLILPTEIPYDKKLEINLLNNMNNRNKVDISHARIIKFFCYILPNITGFIYGSFAINLLKIND